jgi:hypothetical protein
MDPLGLIGIFIGLSIAAWEHRKATRAEARSEQLFRELPMRLVSAVNSASQAPITPQLSPPVLNAPFRTTYADVDNDGKDELLVEHSAGAHGSALLLFGFKDWEFRLLGELGVGTPGGFDIGDFDGDGRIEIDAVEADYSHGDGYVDAPRYRIRYRWTQDGFAEVERSAPVRADPPNLAES